MSSPSSSLSSSPSSPTSVVDHIFSLFAQHGADNYIGEKVSQTEHMIQAAMIAEEKNMPKEVVVAALLHDIGHFLHGKQMVTDNSNEWGVVNHEGLGADYLHTLGFHPQVCDLVRNHVNAKRYLVSKDQDYARRLSEASRTTLTFQGGMMNQQELSSFESHPNFSYYLEMRYMDELAKVENQSIKPLQSYRDMIQACLVKEKIETPKQVPEATLIATS